MIGLIAIVGLTYASATYLVLQFCDALCAKIRPFDDGPKPGKPPVVFLIVASAVVGMALASHGNALPEVGLMAIMTTALAASWYCDVRTGIIPDYFTLIPLLLALGVAVYTHSAVGALIAVLALFIPFAITAFMSKGRGMGWGDVKLASLGGAILGVNVAIVSITVACLAAVAIAWVRGRRGEPVAFAPYLASAIVLGLILRIQ